MSERMLVIGSGGREHALGWKLNQSQLVDQLFFAPGNAGTSRLGKNADIACTDIDTLAEYARKNHIGLTVVGPEAPLERGIVDVFQNKGMRIFGPTQRASQLETSKAFAAEFMRRHGIPSPAFHVSGTMDDAFAFIENPPWPLVVKADGLAAGKGVILPDDENQAKQAVIEMMSQRSFGKAGETIVFQERLSGQEVSLLAFSDGARVVPLFPAQDHKRIFAGDRGPNTGGMGAYAPAPIMTPELIQFAQDNILQPTIDGMYNEGNPYHGVLYAGLILTDKGPKVLEYNVRFGDPETQPLMMLLRSDLAPILLSCIEGTLSAKQVAFRSGATVCVVLAAENYPNTPITGEVIHGLDKQEDENVQVFHAGTLLRNGQMVTSGGRVLGVTATGENIAEAVKRAYSAIGQDGVYFRNMQFRKDIALSAINNKQA